MGILKEIDAVFYSLPTCLTRFENWRHKLCHRSKSLDMRVHNQWIFVAIWHETIRLIHSATVQVQMAKSKTSAILTQKFPALMQLAMVAHQIILDFNTERLYHADEDNWKLRINELGDKIINASNDIDRYGYQMELLAVLKCQPLEPLSSIPDMTRFWNCLVKICTESVYSCCNSGPPKSSKRINCLGNYYANEPYLAKHSLCEGIRIETFYKPLAQDSSQRLLHYVKYTNIECIECRVLYGLIYTCEEYIAENSLIEDYPSNDISGNRKYGRRVLDLFESLFLASTRVYQTPEVNSSISEGKSSSL